MAPTFAWGSVEEADRLLAEGEQLGRAQRYEDALDRFKNAEKAAPRAVHDCWIAVTYLRLGRAAEARARLDRCIERSNGAAAVVWYAKANEEVSAALEQGRFAQLDLEVEPANVVVRVTTSKDDLTFTGSRKIWLPLGKHNVEAVLEGHERKQVTVVLETKQTYPLYLALAPLPAPVVAAPPPPAVVEKPVFEPGSEPKRVIAAPIEPERRYGAWPWISLGGAAVAAGTGAVLYGMALGKASDLSSRIERDEIDDEAERAAGIDEIRSLETPAWACFGVGAALAGAGLYLLSTREPESDGAFRIVPSTDGVILSGKF